MKSVKIIKPIYIRKGAGRSYEALATIYPSGKNIVMDGVEKGENWKGIDDWYYIINDKGDKQYYWRGGIREEYKNLSWGIRSLGIDLIWQETLGENIKVAILDTGIDLNNEDLKNSVIDGFNVLTGESYSTNKTSIQDTDGHGTACATIISSQGMNGIRGVAPSCKLIIIKIAEKEKESDLKRTLPIAIEKAVLLGADIISISSGFRYEDKIVTSTIKKYWKETLFVAAAGNESSYVAFPANLPGMISIGAIRVNNTELGYKEAKFEISFATAMGPSDRLREGVTIVAPGDKIPIYNLQKEVDFDRGTSFATPYVAGVLALLLSYQKKTLGLIIKDQLKIRKAIIDSAIRTTGNSEEWGNGIIDPVNLIFKQSNLSV